MRRFVRTPAVGRAWAVAVVVWRRRPRGRAADCSGLRISSCPWRTIRVYSRRLSGRALGTIGTSETCRRAAAIGGISLRIPGAGTVARALRSGIARHTGGVAVRIGRRRGRTILREFALARRSHLRCSRRAARTAIHCGCVALTIVCRRSAAGTITRHGTVMRWHILLRRRTLIHGAVPRSIARASGTQVGAVDGVHAHLRCPLCGRGARDHGAVLNGGRWSGDV